MTIIPPPPTYKSSTMNQMMMMVNPSNIDGVMAEIERMKKDQPMVTHTDYIMRLSIETNLAALSDRRQQYVECGVLTPSAYTRTP
jgi:hypothetical protein